MFDVKKAGRVGAGPAGNKVSGQPPGQKTMNINDFLASLQHAGRIFSQPQQLVNTWGHIGGFAGDFVQARVGERIRIEVTVAHSRPEGLLCEGTADVGDRAVARAEFSMVYVPYDRAPLPDREIYEWRTNRLRAWGLGHLRLPPLEVLLAEREKL